MFIVLFREYHWANLYKIGSEKTSTSSPFIGLLNYISTPEHIEGKLKISKSCSSTNGINDYQIVNFMDFRAFVQGCGHIVHAVKVHYNMPELLYLWVYFHLFNNTLSILSKSMIKSLIDIYVHDFDMCTLLI